MLEGKKVIVIYSESFGLDDIMDFFKSNGAEVVFFEHPDRYDIKSKDLEEKFYRLTETKDFDFVYSFNYYPIISKCCSNLWEDGYRLKYISLVYDNPHILLYSYTLMYPCNYVFLFDYSQYQEFYNGGIRNVYYTPLPVYTKRIDRQLGKLNKDTVTEYEDEVSFVGGMYNESHNLYDRLMEKLKISSPYTAGYLDSIVEAQSHVYGEYLLEKVLSDEIIDEMYKAYPYEPNSFSIASKKYVYANYFLGRKVAELERFRILSMLSADFNVSLYTYNDTPNMPYIHNKGKVDYYNDMPGIFRNSKINLNISLKTIKTGIPLRAMDIMACGGFLISNYQEDFLRHFEPGTDFVYFTGDEDLHEKTEYFLSHEKERKEIALNGYNNVMSNYTYENIITQMIEIALEETI